MEDVCFAYDRFTKVEWRYKFDWSLSETVVKHYPKYTSQFLAVQLASLLSLCFGFSITESIFDYFGNNCSSLLHFFSQKCLFAFALIVCLFQSSLTVQNYFAFQTKTRTEFSTYDKVSEMPYIAIIPPYAFVPIVEANWYHNLKHVQCLQTQWNSKAPYLINACNHFSISFDKRTWTIRHRFLRKNTKAISFVMNDNYTNLASNEILGNPESDLPQILKFEFKYDEVHFKKTIQINKSYKIRVKHDVFKKLEAPFDTDCFRYDVEARNDRMVGRFRCLDNCIKKGFFRKFGCYQKFLFRLSEEELKDAKFCEKETKNQQEWISKQKNACSQQCKLECTYFNFEIAKTSENSIRLNLAEIEISFDTSNPVVVYVSEPVLTELELFYELGGTIGLWFGLSILTVYSYLLRIRRNFTREI